MIYINDDMFDEDGIYKETDYFYFGKSDICINTSHKRVYFRSFNAPHSYIKFSKDLKIFSVDYLTTESITNDYDTEVIIECNQLIIATINCILFSLDVNKLISHGEMTVKSIKAAYIDGYSLCCDDISVTNSIYLSGGLTTKSIECYFINVKDYVNIINYVKTKHIVCNKLDFNGEYLKTRHLYCNYIVANDSVIVCNHIKFYNCICKKLITNNMNHLTNEMNIGLIVCL